MKTFILLILLSFNCLELYGCSCAYSTIKESYERADFIFYGRHIAKLKSNDFYAVNGFPMEIDNFEVVKFYKGVPNTSIKNVKTILDSERYIFTLVSTCKDSHGACGKCFDNLKYYLVYCYSDPFSGFINTNSCSRTRIIINGDFSSANFYNDKEGNEDEELMNLSKADSVKHRGSALVPEQYSDKLKNRDVEIDFLKSENRKYYN